MAAPVHNDPLSTIAFAEPQVLLILQHKVANCHLI